MKQAGSLVAPDRLRFDFVHTGTIAAGDLEAIERIVNTQIMRNTKVQTTLRRTDEAMALGAMALFGEKYGDTVRVVDIPGLQSRALRRYALSRHWRHRRLHHRQ